MILQSGEVFFFTQARVTNYVSVSGLSHHHIIIESIQYCNSTVRSCAPVLVLVLQVSTVAPKLELAPMARSTLLTGLVSLYLRHNWIIYIRHGFRAVA